MISKNNWWKWMGIVLVTYSIIFGFMGPIPALAILHETMRNVYFHVPMWFAMIVLFIVNAWYSVKYLRSGKEDDDRWAVESANVDVLLGVLGIVTGMIWAKFTWG